MKNQQLGAGLADSTRMKEKFADRGELPGAACPRELTDLSEDLPRAGVKSAVTYLWGDLPPGPRVAIVGSRRASPAGIARARQVARELADSGVTIVSGGAVGIDRAAHEGALDVRRPTLVVGPVWLERAYPVCHRPLFSRILSEGGGYLCPSGHEAQPLRPYFRKRNAVLVALSHVVILGEAGQKSGALNAMAVARRLGRHRFVLPWELEEVGTLGCESELLGRGATPYFRREQVLRLLECGTFENSRWLEALQARVNRRQKRAFAKKQASGAGSARSSLLSRRFGREHPQGKLTSGGIELPCSTQAKVLACVDRGAVSIDDICRETGLPAQVIQHEVLVLILQGQLVESEGLVKGVPFAR